jgi:hypothetical protein
MKDPDARVYVIFIRDSRGITDAKKVLNPARANWISDTKKNRVKSDTPTR